MAKKKTYKYVPTEAAKARPVRSMVNKCAYGGPVVIKKNPPAVSYTVPEATEEQYKALYEATNGETYLVEKVEA